MEINEISLSVNSALTALEQMQRMTALNMANANNVGATKFQFNIGDVLNNVAQSPTNDTAGIQSVVKQSTIDSNHSVKMDQEVIISQQIAGKYAAIIEGFNKHAGLYQLALGKGR